MLRERELFFTQTLLRALRHLGLLLLIAGAGLAQGAAQDLSGAKTKPGAGTSGEAGDFWDLIPHQVIVDIVEGRIDTHVDLPERHPAAYALRHEFLDTLGRSCELPDQFDNLVLERELMDQIMFSEALYDTESLGGLSGASLEEATLRFMANPIGKLGPAHLVRLAIAEDPEAAVRQVVMMLGGCDAPMVERLKFNLDAIAVMGPLMSDRATLLSAEVSADGDQLNCYYPDPERENYRRFQPYQTTTLVNVTEYLPPFFPYRGKDRFFVRSNCPAVPDPAFALLEYRIHAEPDLASLPQGDAAEKIAAAFLDQYIPEYVQRQDGAPVTLSPELRSRYFAEIVKFERIPVSQEDIERVRQERAGSMQRLDDVSIAMDIRLELYAAQHGRELWAIIEEVAAETGSRGADYIGVRPNTEFFDELD